MRVFLIARQHIINPDNKEFYGDKDLWALDGIAYGPVHCLKEIPDVYMEELIAELNVLRPDFRADEYKLKKENEQYSVGDFVNIVNSETYIINNII